MDILRANLRTSDRLDTRRMQGRRYRTGQTRWYCRAHRCHSAHLSISQRKSWRQNPLSLQLQLLLYLRHQFGADIGVLWRDIRRSSATPIKPQHIRRHFVPAPPIVRVRKKSERRFNILPATPAFPSKMPRQRRRPREYIAID